MYDFDSPLNAPLNSPENPDSPKTSAPKPSEPEAPSFSWPANAGCGTPSIPEVAGLNLDKPDVSDNSEPKLLLRIDWGCPVKFGTYLSPKFTLIGEGLKAKPEVRFRADDRLVKVWDEHPEVCRFSAGENGDWGFYEHLNIVPTTSLEQCAAVDSQYTITLNTRYPEHVDGELKVYEFALTIRVCVSGNQQREVVIDADSGALINTDHLDWSQFDKIRINAGDGALVNLRKSILDQNAQRDDSEEKNDSSKQLFEFPAPVVKTGPDEESASQLLLKMTQNGCVHLYHLFGKPEILVGRSSSGGGPRQQACDMVYRLYQRSTPRDSVKCFLSKWISRNHMKIRLMDREFKGIGIANIGTYGVGVQIFENSWLGKDKKVQDIGLERGECQYIEWEKFKNGYSKLCVSKLGWLKLTTHAVSVKWDDLESQLQNGGALRANQNELWNLGKQVGVDYLRLERGSKLNTDRKEVLDKLDPKAKAMYEAHKTEWEKTPAWKEDPLADSEDYYFLLRGITLGGDPKKDTISLPNSGLKKANVAICFYDEHFSMANTNPYKAVYYQDASGKQQELWKDKPVSLVPGMVFDFGDAHIEVLANYRTYLESLPEGD